MKTIVGVFIGIAISISFVACSMGGKPVKSVKYKDFPSRSDSYSAYMKCLDGDKVNACKYSCKKYSKNNTCKKKNKRVKKKNIQESLSSGFVLISKTYFIELLKNQK